MTKRALIAVLMSLLLAGSVVAQQPAETMGKLSYLAFCAWSLFTCSLLYVRRRALITADRRR